MSAARAAGLAATMAGDMPLWLAQCLTTHATRTAERFALGCEFDSLPVPPGRFNADQWSAASSLWLAAYRDALARMERSGFTVGHVREYDPWG